MARSRSVKFAPFTSNGYDLSARGSSKEEQAPPSAIETRRLIFEALDRMDRTGEKPSPEALARMEAGLRDEAANQKTPPQAMPIGPHVYYFRVGNRIKIGHTGNLTTRAKDLMPEEILGWEPGDSVTERLRHRQFAGHRIAREWFEDCKAIRDHIASLSRS